MRRLFLTLPLALAAAYPASADAQTTRHDPAARQGVAARDAVAQEQAAPPGDVALASRPGTALDAAARQLLAQDLAESRRARDKPLVLTGSAHLGAASDRPALFVQLQSARECGSAGCSTTIFLWQKGAWRKVLDGVDGKLTIGPSKTRGMDDLISDKVRYAWNGTEYKDTRPEPPPIDLRRHR